MYQGTDHQIDWLTVNLIHFGYLKCDIIRFIYVWLSNHCNKYTVELTNRVKGSDTVDRLPEELWVEVCTVVKEEVTKSIPQKKQCKKAKWLSQEVLQIAEKRREAKSKGEKERYIHLNAEFQRIARRDKAFLSDQCKDRGN